MRPETRYAKSGDVLVAYSPTGYTRCWRGAGDALERLHVQTVEIYRRMIARHMGALLGITGLQEV